MPRDIDGLLDDIDRLVDEQLAGGPVDDYGVDRHRLDCPHCHRGWHGIAITERVEQMRWLGRFDDDYRVADDDSPVLCPGSDFIGPVQALSAGGYSIRDLHVRERLSMRRDIPFYVTVDLDPVNRSFLTRYHIARAQRLVEQMHARIQELMQ